MLLEVFQEVRALQIQLQGFEFNQRYFCRGTDPCGFFCDDLHDLWSSAKYLLSDGNHRESVSRTKSNRFCRLQASFLGSPCTSLSLPGSGRILSVQYFLLVIRGVGFNEAVLRHLPEIAPMSSPCQRSGTLQSLEDCPRNPRVIQGVDVAHDLQIAASEFRCRLGRLNQRGSGNTGSEHEQHDGLPQHSRDGRKGGIEVTFV